GAGEGLRAAPQAAGAAEAPVPVDRHGDALPPGALARMGTIRFRPGVSVARAVFSPDGKLLASESWDRTVRVWATCSGRELHRLGGRGPRVELLGFCDEGKAIAARGDAGLRLLDAATGKEQRSVEVPWLPLNALSADGKTLVSAEFKGKAIHVYD